MFLLRVQGSYELLTIVFCNSFQSINNQRYIFLFYPFYNKFFNEKNENEMVFIIFGNERRNY